jgi:hypothetical protein
MMLWRESIMSSPCELIIVWCPCGALYRDSWRPSMNLSLEDFSDDYVERMSSTTCPNCGLSTRMGTLLSRFENGHLRLDFEAIPKPLPVILYLNRPKTNQAETFTWIKNWLTQHGQAGVAQLQEILALKGDLEPDTYGVCEELSEILFEWRFMDELRLENEGKEPELPPGTV